VQAMIWGDSSNISNETNNIFRSSGISHVLVLSGYNLAIVAALAAFLFQKLSYKKKVFMSIAFVFLFLILAHTSAPVWRASVMSFYTLLTILFLKPTNAKFALWLTCVIFFLYSPVIALFDASFHLSFLATASIIYFFPILQKLTKEKYFTKNIKTFDSVKYKIYKNILDIILVTVSANILIAPYIIYQFGYFKFSGLIISILISVLIPLIMFFGFVSGVLGMFSNFIFLFIAKIFAFISHICVLIMSTLAELGSESSPLFKNPISFFSVFIIYIFIIIFYFYLKFLENKIISKE
jgi:competence protein ComEC